MKNTKVTLVPLTEDDREQFILDNQWAFKYGAMMEFGERDDHIDDDGDLTSYLWPIVREMIKTAIENNQNLIVEGCYIPFDWQKDFDSEYLESIKYYCLIMSEEYIRNHFADIKKYANVIENRLDVEWCNIESVLTDNAEVLALAKKHNVNFILIDDQYEINIDLD